jgi:hypothetical protein
MAGKNTAVFGIYTNYVSVERGVVALRDGRLFQQRHFRALSAE